MERRSALHLRVILRAWAHGGLTTGQIQTLNEVEKSSDKWPALFLQLMTAKAFV